MTSDATTIYCGGSLPYDHTVVICHGCYVVAVACQLYDHTVVMLPYGGNLIATMVAIKGVATGTTSTTSALPLLCQVIIQMFAHFCWKQIEK